MRTIFPTTRNHYKHGASASGASMIRVESQLAPRCHLGVPTEWEHQKNDVARPLVLPCGILKIRALGEKDKASFKARVSFGDVSVRRDEAATMWGVSIGDIEQCERKKYSGRRGAIAKMERTMVGARLLEADMPVRVTLQDPYITIKNGIAKEIADYAECALSQFQVKTGRCPKIIITYAESLANTVSGCLSDFIENYCDSTGQALANMSMADCKKCLKEEFKHEMQNIVGSFEDVRGIDSDMPAKDSDVDLVCREYSREFFKCMTENEDTLAKTLCDITWINLPQRIDRAKQLIRELSMVLGAP